MALATAQNIRALQAPGLTAQDYRLRPTASPVLADSTVTALHRPATATFAQLDISVARLLHQPLLTRTRMPIDALEVTIALRDLWSQMPVLRVVFQTRPS